MPLNIDLTKKLVTKTDRVKCVSFHPVENWVAVALYNGSLMIYDYISGGTVKVFQVSEHPLRACQFIPGKKMIACGGDDLMLRIFHVGNGKLVHEMEAHGDYVRSIAVSPCERYVLTSSDDANIKLWDVEDNFSLKTTYEGHAHYVMQVAWHPDGELFASASLDKKVRVWSVSPNAVVTQPNFVLKGHTKAVNCVCFAKESSIIVSGGDDFIAIWDFHTKQLLHKLEGHTAPVNAVALHPVYPLIISGGEDNHIRLWNTNTYKKEDVMQFHMNRIWTLDARGEGSCLLAIGADNGCAVVELGKNKMIFSYHAGKVLSCRHNRVYVSNLKAKAQADVDFEDGAIIETPKKELGTTDMFASSCSHNPNGRLVAICGENEYLVYTAQALRSKAFGSAQSFVWSSEGDYATLNNKNNASKCIIQVYKDFKEFISFNPHSTVSDIYGGRFLGASLVESQSFAFYDWNTGSLIRALDVPGIKNVVWSANGDMVVIISDTATYILQLNEEALVEEQYDPEEGFLNAFTDVGEIYDEVSSLIFVDTLCNTIAFVTTTNKLNLWIQGHLETLGFTGSPLTLAGYSDNDQALVLIDRYYNVCFYSCSKTWVQYHLDILSQNYAAADEVFQSVPSKYHNKLARFLDSQGHREKALKITCDDEHKLSLALGLNNLALAAEVLEGVKKKDSTSITLQQQWKSLGDAALLSGNIDLAGSCFIEAKDYTSALLIFSSTNERNKMNKLAEVAEADGQIEIAAYTYIHLNADPDKVINLYLKHNQPAQAALFARTYKPSSIANCVKEWEKQLGTRFQINVPECPAPVGTEVDDLEIIEAASTPAMTGGTPIVISGETSPVEPEEINEPPVEATSVNSTDSIGRVGKKTITTQSAEEFQDISEEE